MTIPTEDPNDPEWPAGRVVPDAAVDALMAELNVGIKDYGDRNAYERWRAALAAALPHLDRSAYRRGFDVAERSAIGRLAAASLIVGPTDLLVLNIGPHASPKLRDDCRNLITQFWPETADRILIASAESLAVIRTEPTTE